MERIFIKGLKIVNKPLQRDRHFAVMGEGAEKGRHVKDLGFLKERKEEEKEYIYRCF